MRLLAFVLTGVALLSAAPAVAETSGVKDAKAEDALALFQSFCLATAGDRAKAEGVIGDGNAFGKKLSSELMAQLQGKAGGVGWAIRSPRGAQLLLGYSDQTICEVRIAEADEASVVAAYDAIVGAIGDGKSSAPKPRTQNSVTLTYRQFDFSLGGRKAIIGLTTASQRVGEQQHLITFGFVS